MNNTDNPEVLAVVPPLTAVERRRREVMLARVLLLAVDIIVSGEGLGLDTARDLVREVKHCYPELLADWEALGAESRAVTPSRKWPDYTVERQAPLRHSYPELVDEYL